MIAETLDRYFAALRAHDWEALAACVSEDVHREGPYCDVFRGREPYVEYLAKVVPSLAGYELRVSRVREVGPRTALVELCETVDVDGRRTEYPELLLFDFDDEGRIARIDVYIKQPPRARAS